MLVGAHGDAERYQPIEHLLCWKLSIMYTIGPWLRLDSLLNYKELQQDQSDEISGLISALQPLIHAEFIESMEKGNVSISMSL